MKKSKTPPLRSTLIAAGFVALIPLAIVAIRFACKVTDTASFKPAATVAVSTPARPPGAAALSPGKIVSRPLPVSLRRGTHEWTQGDGTTPAIIEKIAHNPDEFIRLVEENNRIKRRQLVYRKEPVWVAVEQSKATGQPVSTMKLPGLDGQELEVELTNADLAPSGLSGTFAGRIAGRGQSMVTLAFKQGREAFTVISPEDGIYLQGHPREPGEIIVTSFDPDSYTPYFNCDPIKTSQAPKQAE